MDAFVVKAEKMGPIANSSASADVVTNANTSIEPSASNFNIAMLGAHAEDMENKLKAYRYIGTYIKKLTPAPFLIDTRADISHKDSKYFAEYGYDNKPPPYESELMGKKITLGDLKGCTVAFCGRSLSYEDLCAGEEEPGNAPMLAAERGRKPQLTSHYVWWVRVPANERCPDIILDEVRDCWHGMRPAVFVMRDIKHPGDGFFYSASPFTEQMFMQCDFDVVLRGEPPNLMDVRGISIPILPIEQVQKKAMAKRNNTKNPDAVIELRKKLAHDEIPEPKVISKRPPPHAQPRMFPRYRYTNKDEADPGALFKRFLREACLDDVLNPESDFVGNVADDATLGLCFDTSKISDIHPEIKQIEGITTDTIEYEEIDPNLPREEYYKQKYQQEKMKKRQAARDAKFENAMVKTHALYGHIKWDKVMQLTQESLTSPSFSVPQVAPLFFDVWSKDADLLPFRKTGPNRNVTIKRQNAYFTADKCKKTETLINAYLAKMDKKAKEDPLPDVWIPYVEPEQTKEAKNPLAAKKKPTKPTQKNKSATKSSNTHSKSDKETMDTTQNKGPEHKNEDTKDDDPAAGVQATSVQNDKDDLGPVPAAHPTTQSNSEIDMTDMADKPDNNDSDKDSSSADDDAFLALMNSAKKTQETKKPKKEDTSSAAAEPNAEPESEPDKGEPTAAKKKPAPKRAPAKPKQQAKSTKNTDAPKAAPPRIGVHTYANTYDISGFNIDYTSMKDEDPQDKTEKKKAPARKRPAASKTVDVHGLVVDAPKAKKTKADKDEKIVVDETEQEEKVEFTFETIDQAKTHLKKLQKEYAAEEKQIDKVYKECLALKGKVAEYEKNIANHRELVNVAEKKLEVMNNKKASMNDPINKLQQTIDSMKKAQELEAKKKLIGKHSRPDGDNESPSAGAKKVRFTSGSNEGDEEDLTDSALTKFVMNIADQFNTNNGKKALGLAIKKSVEANLIMPESIVYEKATIDDRKVLARLATLLAVYLPKDFVTDEMRACSQLTKSNVVRHVLTVLDENKDTLVIANILKRYEDFENSEKKKAFLESLGVALAAFCLRNEELKALKEKQSSTKKTPTKKGESKDESDDDDSDDELEIPGFV